MTPAALFVTLVLSFAPSAPATQSCTLPGLWLGQDRNRESVGMWLEFAEDGTVLRANGRIVNGSWKQEGDAVILTGPPRLSQRVALKVEGDEMTRKAEAAVFAVEFQDSKTLSNKIESAGVEVKRPDTSEALVAPPAAIALLEEQKLSRMTAATPGVPPIVGAWSYKHKNGRTTLERYSPRQRFVILDPLAAQRGTFAVESGKLSVTADGNTMLVPISCTPGSFDLEVNGRKMRFMKFQ